MITKATQQIDKFSEEIDNIKNKLIHMDSKTRELVFSLDNVEPLILYYAFLSDKGTDSFDMEIETIDRYVGKYSKSNSEKLKALTSLLKSDRIFTNMFGFSGLVEVFNNKLISMGTLTPHSMGEIAWTYININGIKGVSNFPYKGDTLKYINSCIKWESWEMPPLFFSFPIVLNMFETNQLKNYGKILPKLKNINLFDLSTILDDNDNIVKFDNVPYLYNYLKMNSNEAKYIVSKIMKTNEQIKGLYN